MNNYQNRRKRGRETEFSVCKQSTGNIQMADMDTEDLSGENSDDKTFNQKLLSGIFDIQQTLNNLVLKFESQSEEINTLKNDLYAKDGIEDRLQAVTTETDDQTSMISELKGQNMKLSKELDTMKSYVVHLESRLDCQQSQISSLVERSMRENAIVVGVKENKDENVKVELQTLFKSLLKLDGNIKIDRAHRIGTQINNEIPRPIVVKFHDYNDRELVINTARKIGKENKEALKGIYFSPQFPDDMRENRKRLVQIQKEYKDKNVETQIKGNNLFFNKSGTKYVEKVSVPKAFDVLNSSESKHGKFQVSKTDNIYDGNHAYCAAAARTSTYAKVREAARQIIQGPQSAHTYNTLVYRFTDKDGHIHDGFDDDRDYGTGSRILAFLKEIDMTNVTVISSRTPPTGVARISTRRNNLIIDTVRSCLRRL